MTTTERTRKPKAWLPPLPRSIEIEPQIVYPESDGEPMAQNTLQFLWITLIYHGLESLFADEPLVFIAGDLFWYPVEGDPQTRMAPDVMVVFGRPKGHRGSYLQWIEAGIAPQVVFEILSPGNRMREMMQKFQFYEDFGVEEYYVYDPHTKALDGWQRSHGKLREIAQLGGWVSPRLGVRFEMGEAGLELYDPHGQRFESYMELNRRAEEERQRAEEEHQRAEEERQRAEEERQRAEILAEQLRELGVKPRA